MKNELSKKLAGYSSFTTVILLSAQHLNAQIIYTDISDVKVNPNNSVYELDLNNDGIADFGMQFNSDSGIQRLRGYCYGVGGCNDNSILVDSEGYGPYLVAKLHFLETIAPVNHWGEFDYEVQILAYSSSQSQAGFWKGGVLNGYAGLKLNLGGNSYYGWMRCYVRKDAYLLTVKDYAYNSIPNMPINAGDEGCSDNYEPNNSKPQATSFQTNTLIRAQVANTNDVDWYSFSISGNDNNARIVLSSLLKNFDIKLVDQNGNLLAKSVNFGANNDTIIYNGLTAANYYVKVYGKNGSFSPVDCYSLFVETSSNPFRESDSQILSDIMNELTVFPNPVSESATIQFSLDKNSAVTIDLFDLQGRKVQSIVEGNYKVGDHQLMLQKKNLTAGVYFLQLKSDSGMTTQKLIIE
jgi:hypothetical protein